MGQAVAVTAEYPAVHGQSPGMWETCGELVDMFFLKGRSGGVPVALPDNRVDFIDPSFKQNACLHA